MFSIFGVTGQTFNGPLEQLTQVPGVIRTRNTRGIARGGEEPSTEMERWWASSLAATSCARSSPTRP